MLTLPGVDAFTFSPFHRHPDLYKPTTRPHPRYNKVDPTSDYEIATIEAEENAKQLAEELDISIAFFDWINVVRACMCVCEGVGGWADVWPAKTKGWSGGRGSVIWVCG